MPAMLEFLDTFKRLCDSIETFGPPIQFVYKHTSKEKAVKFRDDHDFDAVSSLSQMSSASLSFTEGTDSRPRYSF